MKRSEIIKQLMNEGFSERTLINFTDKQLDSLSSRILGEQVATTTVPGQKGATVTVSSKNPNFTGIMTNLQRQGIKNINVTESGVPGLKAKEVKECEGAMPGLKAKKEVKEAGVPGLTAKKTSGELKNGTAEKEMKESGVPGLTAKKSSGELKNGTAQKEMKEAGVPGLTAKKSSGELKNGTAQKEMKESGVPGLKAKSSGKLGHGTAQKEMKEAAGAMPGLTVKGTTAKPTTKSTSKKETKEEEVTEKKPSAGLSKEKKSEVVKKAKAGGDIGKKGKGFEKVVAAAKKGGAKDPKAVAAAAMWKNIKREGKEINEWVEDVAKKHYHPFTSKGDIMEMISSKMEEMNEEGGDNKLPGFLKAKAIKSSGGDVDTMDAPAPAVPKTKPGTKPVTKPGETPKKTPYKPPFPRKNPHPKALSETEKVPVVKPGEKK